MIISKGLSTRFLIKTINGENILKFLTGIDKPINRSPQDVWRYFTESNNWSKWYGGKLVKVDPKWEEGGKLIWESGRPSIIKSIVPLKEITLEDPTWNIITKWIFRDLKEGVFIEVEEDFNKTKPGSEVEWRQGWQSILVKLKQCLETDLIAPIKETTRKSPWWKFW